MKEGGEEEGGKEEGGEEEAAAHLRAVAINPEPRCRMVLFDYRVNE